MTTKKTDWANLDRYLTYEEKNQLLIDWSDYLRAVIADPKKADHDKLLEITKRMELVLSESRANRGD